MCDTIERERVRAKNIEKEREIERERGRRGEGEGEIKFFHAYGYITHSLFRPGYHVGNNKGFLPARAACSPT